MERLSSEVDDLEFNKVDQLNNGSIRNVSTFLSEKNNITNEVSARVQVINKSFYGLMKLFSTISLSREIKNDYVSL